MDGVTFHLKLMPEDPEEYTRLLEEYANAKNALIHYLEHERLHPSVRDYKKP